MELRGFGLKNITGVSKEGAQGQRPSGLPSQIFDGSIDVAGLVSEEEDSLRRNHFASRLMPINVRESVGEGT